MVNFVLLQGMISLGSCLNALCIHQHFFTLAFGNLNDSQSRVSSETHPVSSGLVITFSPEVNFSWTCGVLSNACADWYSVQNSSRLLGRFLVLFLHASPSSLGLCPINSGHFNVPKPKLSPQLMDASRSLLGMSPFSKTPLCYLWFDIEAATLVIFLVHFSSCLWWEGNSRAHYYLRTRSGSSNQNVLIKKTLRVHHNFLHSTCILPCQHIHLIISMTVFAKFFWKTTYHGSPQRHHISDIE